MTPSPCFCPLLSSPFSLCFADSSLVVSVGPQSSPHAAHARSLLQPGPPPVPSRPGFRCLLEFHRYLKPDILNSKLWIFSPKPHLPHPAISANAICTHPVAPARNLELAPDVSILFTPCICLSSWSTRSAQRVSQVLRLPCSALSAPLPACLSWTAEPPAVLPALSEPLTVCCPYSSQ